MKKKFLLGLIVGITAFGCVGCSFKKEPKGNKNIRVPVIKAEKIQQPTGEESKYLTRISDMTSARGNHAMTLLADGRVLITGGVVQHYTFNQNTVPVNKLMQGNNITILKSAEIFNPKTNTFTKISDMNLPHANHAAVLLKDNRVLIVDDNKCEIFNPKTNTFSIIDSIKVNKFGPSKIYTKLMNDENILIIALNPEQNLWEKRETIIIYNPKTNKSKVVNKFKYARWGEAITALTDEKTLIAGGFSFSESKLTTNAEIYDYSTNTLKSRSNSGLQRAYATASLLDCGKILIAGGETSNSKPVSQSEFYDPQKNEFVLGPSMLIPRSKHQAIKLPNGKILFIGGILFKNYNKNKNKTTIEIYNPKTNKFEYGPETKMRLVDGFKLILLKNNKVLITGGFQTASYTTRSSWLYQVK